ncbi:hypothetical protein [Sharpea azabuensis]|uniref:hypothetical protein n=1 Tax=Sharpea azabuensis TaxID=322505 RepID=UPI002E801122|nr:hypothetical protein [Sharpea azabuensis]MEE3307865.1 hypothetical protein [Sharpea azabuensis]
MTGNALQIIDWLFAQDKDKVFEIKEHKEKRSLNANAYAWSLISKIADALRMSKEECYLLMLKRYGQSEIVSVLSEIDVSGYFKYYEPIATATLQGKEFTHYKIFKGSSEYDTREMSILIDGIISEAKEMDIETLPPGEVERIKNMWRTS